MRLPEGYSLEWGGELESARRAGKRLAVVVPATLVLIFGVLFIMFGRGREPVLILGNVLVTSPFGGLLALLLTGTNFSVSSGVGFLALFGVSVQTGVILVTYMNELRTEGQVLDDAIVGAAARRLRPVIMTALVATLGLLPAASSNGIGSDSQKPLAIVVVGGLLSSLALSLFTPSPPLPGLSSAARREERGGRLTAARVVGPQPPAGSTARSGASRVSASAQRGLTVVNHRQHRERRHFRPDERARRVPIGARSSAGRYEATRGRERGGHDRDRAHRHIRERERRLLSDSEIEAPHVLPSADHGHPDTRGVCRDVRERDVQLAHGCRLHRASTGEHTEQEQERAHASKRATHP